MRRTTISLPDDLGLALEREAHRRHTSQSEVVRDALRTRLEMDGKKRKIGFAAVGRSTDGRTAAEAKQMLRETWADHIEKDSFADRDR